MSAKDKADEEKFSADLEKNKDSFKNGPIGKRSITDCLCCLIFICAIVGFCGASAYGWFNGDPKKLLLGWDSDGNGCGYSEATKDYPNLYWPEPPQGDVIKDAIARMDISAAISLLRYGTCVKECPTIDSEVLCHRTENMINNPAEYEGCVYQIGLSFFEEWGVDFSAYTNGISD